MFDVDKLIQCVQGNPALWEKSCKDYSDRNMREKAWNMVGAPMYPDLWETMSPKDKQEKVNEIKNKWRHIRDSFLKSVKQGKTGDAARKKKKYSYADALTFLLQTIEKRRTSGNVSDEEENNDDDDDDAAHSTQAENNEDNTNENTTVGQEVAPSASQLPKVFKRPKARKSTDITLFQSQLLEKLQCSQTVQEEDDPDKLFLLSILPDLKALKEEDKLDFRLHILNFFKDVRRKNTQASGHHSITQPYPLQYPQYQNSFDTY